MHETCSTLPYHECKSTDHDSCGLCSKRRVLQAAPCQPSSLLSTERKRAGMWMLLTVSLGCKWEKMEDKYWLSLNILIWILFSISWETLGLSLYVWVWEYVCSAWGLFFAVITSYVHLDKFISYDSVSVCGIGEKRLRNQPLLSN